ncbi:hypothetical protein [Polaribacter sp. Z022]|uniref:hypothetical protein n=1 Tax=Polaribacter sp. Z022 TaxID=2927125 RepID=UPI00202137AC|nr:hypothetical protein [Polaribacter sp. Z022]MCL7754998.1 hypothetical protein [Polaribacter sp. Z022]
MKNYKPILLILFSLFISCSDKNQEHLEKVKQRVKEDALGVDMKYKNIEFQWIDTLFVKEKLTSLKKINNTEIQSILDTEYFVKDNFKTGKLFTKEYLTKERIIELRNWETKVAHSDNSGYYKKQGYKDYLDFAFKNRNASKSISELCNQIEKTDKLLEKYNKIENGDLELIENSLWYYKRIDDFESNNKPEKLWSNLYSKLETIKSNQILIDSLSKLNPDQIIQYKSLNKFTINNPILNGAEQELKEYFIFDKDFNITERIDFKK